jgi:hypothetical protein
MPIVETEMSEPKTEGFTLYLTPDEAIYVHACLGWANQNFVQGTDYGSIDTVFEVLDEALLASTISEAETRKYDQRLREWYCKAY